MKPEKSGFWLAVIALGVVPWMCARVVSRFGQQLFGPQRSRAVPWGAPEGFLLLVACAAQFICALWQLQSGSSDEHPPLLLVIAAQLSLLIDLSLPIMLLVTRGAQLYQMGLHCSHFGRNVLAGLGACVLAFLPVMILFQASSTVFEPRRHPLEVFVRSSPTLEHILLSTLFAVVLAPFLEELLFRGILLLWLRRLFGPWPAILLSSAVFAVLHVDAWPAPIPLFVLALFLGYLTYRTSSLVAPIVLHATFNGVSMLVLVLQVFWPVGTF